jgi:hypothetical protein
MQDGHWSYWESSQFHGRVVLYITSHVVSVKMTVHPVLHSTQIPMREAIDRPGTMCPVRATGRLGMFILHVCVDVTVSPLGRLIVRGTTACFTFCIGMPSITKSEVAPVSAMAWVAKMTFFPD